MESSETTALKRALISYGRKHRRYGLTEVTIGFYADGLGDERVDYMDVDRRNVFRCYEIKVTSSDLKSSAKKSWYGNLNYLVVSESLYEEIEDFSPYIGEDIGIIVGESFKFAKRAKRCHIPPETVIMLKDSLIRSLWWRMVTVSDYTDEAYFRQKEKQERALKKKLEYYCKEAEAANNIIRRFEIYHRRNTGEDLSVEDMAKKEEALYWSRRRGD